jgi:hypothetical protein
MAGGYRKWSQEDRAETTEGEPIQHWRDPLYTAPPRGR